jgi:predicted transposase YbfD/YdcC
LRGFLKLANGLPSHDTFSRLSRRLDQDQFKAVFQRFMMSFSTQCQGVIAIDGKLLRRSFDRERQIGLAHGQRLGLRATLGLAQILTDEKSNEITAVPKLLEMLSLRGTIVTVDALNCQRAIAGLYLDGPACNAATAKPAVDAIMAVSRRERPMFQPIPALPPSVKLSESAKPLRKQRLKRLLSAALSPRPTKSGSAPTLWRTLAWKIACIGALTSS